MKKIFTMLLCLFLLTGCDLFKSDVMEDINIYTTTYPVKYLTETLYGDHSTIYSIYPNGVNFKEYKLSNKKLNEFAKSDLFIFSSQDEDRNYAVEMININKELKLIDSNLGMNYTHSIEELWLNPYNYLMMAKNIKNSLSEYISNPYLISNKEKTGIEDKYEELNYELSKLDANYKDVFKDAKYTTIVTDNELFKFLEKYNIEVIYLEEEIKNITIKENDTLSNISKTYNVSISDILTYNNMLDETVKVGQNIKLPIKVIDSSDINKVKKLIQEKQIKYIYSNKNTSNETVNNLIKDKNLELITINTMYSIDGGITNTNETYLTIMNDNLELFKKELYK